MKKWSLFLLFLLITIFIAAILAWTNKKAILTHFLSNQLHTSVTMQAFDIGKKSMDITQIWIGNPPPAKTPTAFTAETISLQTTVNEILDSPLIIEEIDINAIFVGIEFYNINGDDNNWSRILKSDHKEQKNGRPYLIRKLILRNLTVELTKTDGKPKRYPTIPKMEFYNISNETGFPIEEIQKAIFKLMLQDLFKQLNLDQLLKGIFPNTPLSSPLKFIPDLFK